MRGFKEIRVLKKESYFKNNLVQNAEKFADSQILINFFSALPKYIFEMVIITFVAGFSVAIGFMADDPVNLIPTLGVFGIASIRLMPLARNFSFTLSRINYTRDTVKKLAMDLREADVKGQRLSRQNKKASTPVINTVKQITLENISYTYPKSIVPSLKNISLTINEGEHVGIVGHSGAGKTTLVDTLMGLLRPTQGRILINGIDITDHPEHLWQHVAYLPQEIFMIDGSVKQNIALGVPNSAIDEAQLSYAINQAQMHEVVANLPCGIDTNLGENGVNLSGGQRQRIALARAFYFDRKILVLDEATSSLDNDTEDQIIDYLKSIKNNVTVISITHRVNSIEHCGRVFQLSNGMLKDLNKQSSAR